MGNAAAIRTCRQILGPLVGYFKDIHESPANSEGSDEDVEAGRAKLKPKDHHKISRIKELGLKASIAKKAREFREQVPFNENAALAYQGWMQYQSTVEVTESVNGDMRASVYAGIRAHKAMIHPSMLNCLCQYTYLHTIDICHSNLTDIPPGLYEIELLKVLKLSHNGIRSLERTVLLPKQARPLSVTEMSFGNNLISSIDCGALSEDVVGNLVVLNLARNRIKYLPPEFLKDAVMLRFLDISFNGLEVLPDMVCKCSSLEVLAITNNQLTRLPEPIEMLQKLRKLFCSYNRLTCLPALIGECSKLKKIHVVSNEIRFLPDSVIKLWKRRGGRLEELLVDLNPLLVPSITAFEMGGLDQAMNLFSEWIEVQNLSRRTQALALQDEADAVSARKSHSSTRSTAQRKSPVFFEHAVPLSTFERQASRSLAIDLGISYSASESPDAEAAPAKPESIPSGLSAYYFSDDGDFQRTGFSASKIAEIRSAEVSLLMMKKALYVTNLRADAEMQWKQASERGGQGLSEVPDYVLERMDENFTPSTWHGRIRVTETDLLFYLLVYATKPMFATCTSMFKSFAAGEYIMSSGWNELMRRVPVTLGPNHKEEMWNLMAWREPCDRICLDDFIAAWHTHDVSERDAWIVRVARTLRLEYYDMDLNEMNERLRAKGAGDAHATLDFDGELGPSAEPLVFPAPTEGERFAADASSYVIGGVDASTGDAVALLPVRSPKRAGLDVGSASSASKATSASKLTTLSVATPRPLPVISLTSAMYAIREAELRRLDNDSGCGSGSDDDSLQSHQLSQGQGESSDSEISDADDFDAKLCLEDIERGRSLLELRRRKEEWRANRHEVTSDESLARLMELPIGQIGTLDDMFGRAEEDAAAPRSQKLLRRLPPDERSKKRVARPSASAAQRDTRFKTDVYAVRQSLREAYRSVPHTAFVSFVGRVLRGLKSMKHYDITNRVTYWHADEPSFRSAALSNRYSRQTLLHMGFVCVNETYWVWPAKHLNHEGMVGTWGHTVAPASCPGFEETRLEDMILLFTLCQRSLVEDGRRFSGHVKG